MENKKDIRRLPGLIAGIKIEPGTLGAPPGRLPSFGGRRDLTLGSPGPSKLNQNNDSKPKRVYTPNLNVQRNKNKADANVKDEHANSKDKWERRKDDGKFKKRDKPNNLIQSTGVFAEGIAAAAKNRRSGGGGGGGDRDSSNNFLQKPKLNLQYDRKIDKEEEEMKLKELLRDDFVDDPSADPDTENAPVKLPMLSTAKLKSEVKEEAKPKTEETVGAVKIKKEVIDDEEMDVKPKLENGVIKPDKEPKMTKMQTPELLNVGDLLKSKEAEMIFLQLPDCLPGLKPEAETVAPARPSKPSASTATSSQAPPNNATETSPTPKHCTLSTLSEGCIGKLQLMKSGKARLVLGNNVLYVDMGTQVCFRQDLIAVNLDQSSHGGDMINLGPVKTRLVCSPDWETMLTKAVT
ncbi:DNA-directed RNA polymerase III subunit RPC4 [Periplaneta americana]|uniref:DNA-directed RNA polymerase III subunit RPC4 n=1 Tax=Periplaneta americana TaxID=6978 RepID=UPI0037E8EAF7